MKKITAIFVFALLLFGCAKDIPKTDPSTDPKFTEVNKWIYDYMEENYLWNEGIPALKLNGLLEYDQFLNSMLLGVAEQNNVNKDDGVWENNARKYFYSYISKNPVASRADKSDYQSHNFGITSLVYTEGDAPGYYVAFVKSVEPNSSADKMGIKRGSVISKIDGVAYTVAQKHNYFEKLSYILSSLSGDVTIEFGDPIISTTGKIIDITNEETVVLKSAIYTTTPIWKDKVLEHDSGTKIAYLNYNAFQYAFDGDLISIFNKWKQQQITELVFDLRYNGGGHVVSSIVLGTLVAGNSYRGQVFSRSTYNKARTLAGGLETDYLVGIAGGAAGNYQPIADALGSSLSGIKTVYVLTTRGTASSSENLINGLRGLGITVRLIGDYTNGKNVGMEPSTKTFDGSSYEFMPITFYTENALGFLDYSGGFAPDIAMSDNAYLPFDFGDPQDAFLSVALKWITTGVKPVLVRSSASSDFGVLNAPESKATGMIQLDMTQD